jgi:hypothetical protein
MRERYNMKKLILILAMLMPFTVHAKTFNFSYTFDAPADAERVRVTCKKTGQTNFTGRGSTVATSKVLNFIDTLNFGDVMTCKSFSVSGTINSKASVISTYTYKDLAAPTNVNLTAE